MAATKPRPLPSWLLPALVAVTYLAYSPAWHGGLLWDDNGHITKTALRSTEGLWRIWFDIGATQQYYPVVHSAFWVFHRLWGDHTLGYHLVNIGLHACSAWLLAQILHRLAVPGAVLAAFVFALHPVHVESVAWITELKNMLSGAAYLAAALAYLRFDSARRPRDYGLALAVFAVALLSKTVTATLPAALLVVFWWRRGTIDWRRDVAPLLPFFVLGIAGGLTTAWVEHTYIGADGADFQIAPLERLLIAGRAIFFYLGKVLWPANLVFVYPRWELDAGAWWQWLFPAGAIALVGAVWLRRRRTRAPLAALLFFIGTLVPALGFVNVYPFRYSFVADHFQYLASIGVIVLATAALARLAERRRVAPPLRIASSAAIVIVLAVLTWQQSRQYASAETLYRTTIARNPSCWLAYNNLGALQLHRSRAETEEAVLHFKDALRLKSDYYEAHYNLGQAFNELGRDGEAATAFRAALAIRPRIPHPHRNLAVALMKLGRFDEAVVALRAAIVAEPNAADLHNDLSAALMQLGQFDAAAAEARIAIRLSPSFADAHFNLGVSLMRLGRRDEALIEFLSTLRVAPNDASAHRLAGALLLDQGRLGDAAAHFQAALRIRPDDAESRAGLARATKGGT